MRRSLGHFFRQRGLLAGCLPLLTSACFESSDPPVSTANPESSSESGEAGSEETGTPEAAWHFVIELENVGPAYGWLNSCVFDLPEGGRNYGPIGPGEAYVIDFDARPGDRLSLASMVWQTNDWFWSTPAGGLALFDDEGQPMTGERASEFELLDAGTELDQAPGEGADQPGQASASGAADPDPEIRTRDWSALSMSGGEFSAQLDANLGPDRVWHFQLRVTNQSSAGQLVMSAGTSDIELAPGVWATHGVELDWFERGAPLGDAGFEALIEDARTVEMAARLFPGSGVTQVVSAGVWAVAPNDDALLFAQGTPALDNGLEALAEDGKFEGLANYVNAFDELYAQGVTEQSVIDYMLGPLPPGGIYRFEFDADPGAHLHLAHMFVPSNDWFIAPAATGLPLFDANDAPIMGDQTEALRLWDAGTEVDQPIGYGLDQVHLQAEGNSGAADPDTAVRAIEGPTALPQLIRLRVLPELNEG